MPDKNSFSLAPMLRSQVWLLALGALYGCPSSYPGKVRHETDASAESAAIDAQVPTLRPTHAGLVSVQEVSLANLAEDTRILTLQASFAPARKPDYEELPGEVAGCKAWVTDLPSHPAPMEEEHVTLTIEHLRGGDVRCHFDATLGYPCFAVDPGDAGSASEPLANLAGYALPDQPPLAIGWTPSGLAGFDAASVAITPGAPFVIDQRSRALIDHLPLTGEAVTLSCEGEHGACGNAAATVVRINATDGLLQGLAPTAMPKPVRQGVEISCATPGTGTLTIPAGAMELLARANAVSPLTRIRTAFMRDGFAIVTNAAPKPPNRTVVLSGRALIAYTNY